MQSTEVGTGQCLRSSIPRVVSRTPQRPIAFLMEMMHYGGMVDPITLHISVIG